VPKTSIWCSYTTVLRRQKFSIMKTLAFATTAKPVG